MTAGDLRLDGLTKSFGRDVVVDDLSLHVAAGSFFALVGPSGCGKTTTLRMVAGLERPDAGRVDRRAAPRAPSGWVPAVPRSRSWASSPPSPSAAAMPR